MAEAGTEMLRASEFSRLGEEVYLDHAGATLPSERQLQEVFQVRRGHLPWRHHICAAAVH